MEIKTLELTDIVFWGFFSVLTVAQAGIVLIFRLPKDSNFRRWVEPAFFAMLIAVFLKLFVVQAFTIPSSSMEDTLKIGDRIMAARFTYGMRIPGTGIRLLKFAAPKRGDVIIFKYPEDPRLMFIKRCMGLPGDSIMLIDKALYINGKKTEETFVFYKDKKILGRKESVRDNYGPVIVPQGNYFMMGDNRDFSADSRFWGFVPADNLRGMAWIVYWPPKRWKTVKHGEILTTGGNEEKAGHS
jgi:signal peptidase I